MRFPDVEGYEITALLGRGGMGSVYRARRESNGAEVALKILSSALEADSEYILRFRREADALSSVKHPGVARLLDFGRRDDLVYFAMEYVDGEGLDERLRDGPLPVGEALELAAQVADVLEATHRAGLLHRDIKPSNVIVSRRRVRLTDFGLARRMEGSGLTTSGRVMGSLPYMAPEQIRGERLSPACDIYSLGVLLFEMIAGSLPFDAPDQEALATRILTAPAPLLSKRRPGAAPVTLDLLLVKMLAKDPALRPASAGEVARRLREVLPPSAAPHTGDTPAVGHSPPKGETSASAPGAGTTSEAAGQPPPKGETPGSSARTGEAPAGAARPTEAPRSPAHTGDGAGAGTPARGAQAPHHGAGARGPDSRGTNQPGAGARGPDSRGANQPGAGTRGPAEREAGPRRAGEAGEGPDQKDAQLRPEPEARAPTAGSPAARATTIAARAVSPAARALLRLMPAAKFGDRAAEALARAARGILEPGARGELLLEAALAAREARLGRRQLPRLQHRRDRRLARAAEAEGRARASGDPETRRRSERIAAELRDEAELFEKRISELSETVSKDEARARSLREKARAAG